MEVVPEAVSLAMALLYRLKGKQGSHFTFEMGDQRVSNNFLLAEIATAFRLAFQACERRKVYLKPGD